MQSGESLLDVKLKWSVEPRSSANSLKLKFIWNVHVREANKPSPMYTQGKNKTPSVTPSNKSIYTELSNQLSMLVALEHKSTIFNTEKSKQNILHEFRMFDFKAAHFQRTNI